MKKNIIIIGLGDNFRVIEEELVKKYTIKFIIDSNYQSEFYLSKKKFISVKKKNP